MLQGEPDLFIILSLGFDRRSRGSLSLFNHYLRSGTRFLLVVPLVVIHQLQHECPEHVLADFWDKVLVSKEEVRCEVVELGEVLEHSPVVRMNLC